ncbi:MAG TPA: cobalamin-dependent protein, partial [Nitrospirota bacterium]
MRIKFVVPKWSSHSVWNRLYFRFPFLSTAMLTALTPEGHEISVVDENMRPLSFDDSPDLVALTVLTPLAPRAYHIADEYRRRGVKVVMGGFHPTWLPDEALAHADAVVVGEAEKVWAQVVADAEAGALREIYKSETRPDAAEIAVPDRKPWADNKYFFTNLVQTTRGCPFDCKFCSVTAFYGGTYR